MYGKLLKKEKMLNIQEFLSDECDKIKKNSPMTKTKITHVIAHNNLYSDQNNFMGEMKLAKQNGTFSIYIIAAILRDNRLNEIVHSK